MVLGGPTQGAVEGFDALQGEPALVGLVRFRQLGRQRGFGLIGEARTGFSTQGVDGHFGAVEVAVDVLGVEPVVDARGQTALLGQGRAYAVKLSGCVRWRKDVGRTA